MKRIVPLFSLVLLLSCATTKHTAGIVQTEVHTDAQAHFDSLMQAQFALQLERLAVMDGETVTDLVVFDTDKPPVDSTGLPPVKAVLRTQTKQPRQSQEKATVQAETDVQMESETADRTTEVSQTEQVEEKKPSGGINILRLSVGVLFLAVAVFAIWIFYKRIKR